MRIFFFEKDAQANSTSKFYEKIGGGEWKLMVAGCLFMREQAKEAAALAQPAYVKPKGPGRGRRRKPKNMFKKP